MFFFFFFSWWSLFSVWSQFFSHISRREVFKKIHLVAHMEKKEEELAEMYFSPEIFIFTWIHVWKKKVFLGELRKTILAKPFFFLIICSQVLNTGEKKKKDLDQNGSLFILWNKSLTCPRTVMAVACFWRQIKTVFYTLHEADYSCSTLSDLRENAALQT